MDRATTVKRNPWFTVSTLLYGLFLFFALLLTVGMLGAIGPLEIYLWLGLVGTWIIVWTVGRSRDPGGRR